MYFWTTNKNKLDLYNIFKAKIASCSLKSQVHKVCNSEYPPVFRANDNINLYTIDEPCIDLHSFITLSRNVSGGQIEKLDGRSIAEICRQYNPKIIIFAAGIGNETLLQEIGISPSTFCQKRPLNMLVIKNMPYKFFGHCLQSFSDKPTFTITSQEHEKHHTWYVGGQVAENDQITTDSAKIKIIKKVIEKNLSNISINESDCHIVNIDRAEGFCDGKRPDEPSIIRVDKKIGDADIYAVWPTKLVLVPYLAQKLASTLKLGHLKKLDTNYNNSEFPIADYPWQN
jgi:hypothetical protein